MKNQATLQEVQAKLKSILAKYGKFEVAILMVIQTISEFTQMTIFYF